METCVLVVEDDTITRFMMTEMCDELGLSSETVANGHQCLRVLDEAPDKFGVILMDIHMPELSGVDVSKKIRGARAHPPKNLPIFAVTADEAWHDEARCRDAGFDGVIPKPISIAALEAKLFPYAA